MDPIQYTCVFRGVMLVRVPVARPKTDVAPLPAPTPVAKSDESSNRTMAPMPATRLISVA